MVSPMKSISLILPAIALIAGTLPVVKASSDDANLQSMQKALLELQIRVEALEAVKPTFTSLMPNFSERFHVMHRAGEAGDWAVAGHELAEMKRLTALSSYIDAKNGALMQGMMGPRLEALEAAIKHGNLGKFEAALVETVSSCNACHKASGSPFIQVVLDARDSISLRHPHALGHSELDGGHSHGEPAVMKKKMERMQKSMKNMMSGESEQDHHEEGEGQEEHHD